MHAGDRSGGSHSRSDGAPRQLAVGLGQSVGPQRGTWPIIHHSGRRAGYTARQARAFNALVQAFSERVETISPRRGSAASSRGVRWPRSSQGNAAGAASPGTTSSPGPRTRTPSRKVCDAARVSGPEPAAWAGGPERAKDGDGKARAKRELRQEGGTPEQGGGPLPTGTGQGGAAGIGSAHVHHTFDPVSAGAAAARASAGKTAEHARRRAPGSRGVSQSGVAGTEHAEMSGARNGQDAAASIGGGGLRAGCLSPQGRGGAGGGRAPLPVAGAHPTTEGGAAHVCPSLDYSAAGGGTPNDDRGPAPAGGFQSAEDRRDSDASPPPQTASRSEGRV